jgi:glycerol dehydrogenase-like iron-containing ADH family enzyme
MNIVANLLKKYPFVSQTFEIYTDNIFYYLQHLNISRYTMFVCDESVYKIAKHYIIKPNFVCILPYKRALPTTKNAQYILNQCKQNNVKQIVSFGSGAMNDLCKYVSHQLKVKYIFIPTALSMNGIVSNNTSLYSEDGGTKQSFIANAPSVILLDETILIAAPRKFIGSAIMDSLAACTAHHDMLHAHQLNPEEYPLNNITFEMFHGQLSKIFNIVKTNITDIYTNYQAILSIFELLYISGIIMNYYNSSIAFSGGEHTIAHTLESRNPHIQMEFLHGQVISAVLPFYAKLQLEYSSNNYIDRKIIKNNIGNINFKEIAQSLELESSWKDIGITDEEFFKCVEIAKQSKRRPTLLSLML